MNLKLTKLFLVLTIAMALFSCETDLQEIPLIIKETKYKESVLLVNGVSGLGDSGIDVYSNGAKLNASAIAYATTSPKYYEIKDGVINLEAKIGAETIATLQTEIEAGKLYTIYLTGTIATPEIIIKEDDINLDDPNTSHSLTLANLSNEDENGLEMEIFIQGYEEIAEMGFHTATGPTGIMTAYASIKEIPQVLKYNEVITSTKFPASGLIVAFPYRFINAGTNTADKTVQPLLQSVGEQYTGQALADLFTGNITNTTLFVLNHHTTIVVAGTTVHDDKTTFTYDNTDLYSKE